MRLLVCGSRTFSDQAIVDSVLNGVLVDWAYDFADDELMLIEGGAPGADSLAARWADMNLFSSQHLQYPADWKQYGRSAGPIRNRQMLDEGKPTHGIAFVDKPLAESKGTRNMVTLLQDAGISVRIVTSTET